MRALSLYCGAGCGDVGLNKAGIETTTAIDLDPDCCKTFKLNHPNTEVICGRVEDYANSLSNHDAIIGGVPCQPFSKAKFPRTFDACNVSQFWDIVENMKPRYYLMENVKDVVKVCSKPSVLLNCADYGTPQNRLRRIFTNIPIPPKTYQKPVSVKEAIGFDGIVEDRKTTFGEKYCKENGKFRQRSSERPCFTVLVDYRIWLIKDGYARKATEQEVAILQGFPKDYKFYGNNQSVKRQIGNALPSQPIHAIFSQLAIPIKTLEAFQS